MSISRSVTPIASHIFTAFDFVRFVVPKHGIVTATISVIGLPSSFIALAHTRSASVLSSPPEIPITAVFA